MQKIVFIFVVLLMGSITQAGTSASPLGFAIADPVQTPPSNYSIHGARFSLLYGQHRNVRGLDFGVIGNFTEQDFTGTAVSGIFNHTAGETNIVGAQVAGIFNNNKGRTNVYGVQMSIFANVGDYTDIYGVQIGLYNKAREVYGIQIGLVNYCNNLHGIQIGLANYNVQGWFTMAPLINVGF